MHYKYLQTAFTVDLDDLHESNEELTEAVRQNTRRYTNMVSDVVYEMLPDYKHREVMLFPWLSKFDYVSKFWSLVVYDVPICIIYCDI